jgi:hypothetical protein
MVDDNKNSILRVRDYFGYTSTVEFSADWKMLSTEDKEEIKVGVLKELSK